MRPRLPLSGPHRTKDSVWVGLSLTVAFLLLAVAAARLFAKWGF